MATLLGSPAQGENAEIRSAIRRAELQVSHWRITDVLLESYAATDWRNVGSHMVGDVSSSSNANITFIPVSLGNAYLNRYERRNDIADFDRALTWWEWVVDHHWLWGQRWLSAPVVSYLDLSLFRLRSRGDLHRYGSRVQALWVKAMALTEREADSRLTSAFPYLPYDSSLTGDSKAEENAWEAALLAAAANFIPEHPHAAAWDVKARQLAYNAITRPSDPPDRHGLKTATVTEDLELSNHAFSPNPTYVAAVLLLLSQAALPYHLSGREVPVEFQHNLSELYTVYRTYVDSDLRWIVPSDPEGDASLFPFAFDPELEEKAIRCKSDDALLWLQAEPVSVMQPGLPLWTAVLNSKAVMFYVVGSYLWHFGGVPASDPQ